MVCLGGVSVSEVEVLSDNVWVGLTGDDMQLTDMKRANLVLRPLKPNT